ncbi:hypothetical protein TNCV_3781641 [Trichonephila clavipes]|nr:hypothetical protein TNCV_3781641 [Trichonephila clavipes]
MNPELNLDMELDLFMNNCLKEMRWSNPYLPPIAAPDPELYSSPTGNALEPVSGTSTNKTAISLPSNNLTGNNSGRYLYQKITSPSNVEDPTEFRRPNENVNRPHAPIKKQDDRNINDANIFKIKLSCLTVTVEGYDSQEVTDAINAKNSIVRQAIATLNLNA